MAKRRGQASPPPPPSTEAGSTTFAGSGEQGYSHGDTPPSPPPSSDDRGKPGTLLPPPPPLPHPSPPAGPSPSWAGSGQDGTTPSSSGRSGDSGGSGEPPLPPPPSPCRSATPAASAGGGRPVPVVAHHMTGGNGAVPEQRGHDRAAPRRLRDGRGRGQGERRQDRAGMRRRALSPPTARAWKDTGERITGARRGPAGTSAGGLGPSVAAEGSHACRPAAAVSAGPNDEAWSLTEVPAGLARTTAREFSRARHRMFSVSQVRSSSTIFYICCSVALTAGRWPQGVESTSRACSRQAAQVPARIPPSPSRCGGHPQRPPRHPCGEHCAQCRAPPRPFILVMVAILPTLASYTLGGAVIVGGILVPLFLMVCAMPSKGEHVGALSSSSSFSLCAAVLPVIFVLPTGARVVWRKTELTTTACPPTKLFAVPFCAGYLAWPGSHRPSVVQVGKNRKMFVRQE